MSDRRLIRRRTTIVTVALLLCAAAPADAYIGPGAGFALLSSFLVLFTTIVIAILSILFWPFRLLWRLARGKRAPRAAIDRLVIIGFDGQDPNLTDRFMREGLLPISSWVLCLEGPYPWRYRLSSV